MAELIENQLRHLPIILAEREAVEPELFVLGMRIPASGALLLKRSGIVSANSRAVV